LKIGEEVGAEVLDTVGVNVWNCFVVVVAVGTAVEARVVGTVEGTLANGFKVGYFRLWSIAIVALVVGLVVDLNEGLAGFAVGFFVGFFWSWLIEFTSASAKFE
jgi:hypothetical protein